MKNMSKEVRAKYDVVCCSDYQIVVRNNMELVKQYYCYVGDYIKEYHLFSETFPDIRKECTPYVKTTRVGNLSIGDFIVYDEDIFVMVDRDRHSGIFKAVERDTYIDQANNEVPKRASTSILFNEVKVDKICMRYSKNPIKNWIIKYFS